MDGWMDQQARRRVGRMRRHACYVDHKSDDT